MNFNEIIKDLKRLNPDITQKELNAGLLNGAIYNFNCARDEFNRSIEMLNKVADYLKEQGGDE